jgi:hypothetical protein
LRQKDESLLRKAARQIRIYEMSGEFLNVGGNTIIPTHYFRQAAASGAGGAPIGWHGLGGVYPVTDRAAGDRRLHSNAPGLGIDSVPPPEDQAIYQRSTARWCISATG